ncbi:carboxylesterase/lipase family protein [Corynebacterium sp. A21]|uniref:carboxylesterase/lipase family protein n=1 Tax=Corynebacterium sp. A21 TaxID=3457318 RepID=UPI003FD5993E
MNDRSFSTAPVAATTSGYVRGAVDRELGIRTWKGVPFGEDTSGNNRFRAPRPAPGWYGVRDCTSYGPPAPQPVYSWTDRIIGSEDCLHLDIVRPDTEEELPVVVYFHGGSFIMGSSHEQMLRGFHLATRMNVVYVSVNFRLGTLGYLDMRSIGDDCVATPALRDQLLSLQWVHENIDSFGGDPDNVTIMGESAGGASVITLMCVPAAKGLYHRAIAQSPPIAMLHSTAQSTLWARELVFNMAHPRQTTLNSLRQESAADLVRAGQSMMWGTGELIHLNPCFSPTVDGDTLPAHPLSVFDIGEQGQVPLLIGTNHDETSFGKFFYLRSSARSRAALRLLSAFDPVNAGQVLDAYGGAVARPDFAELLADAIFWAPAVRLAGDHSRANHTWMYRFDYAPPALRWLGLGAMHSLELSAIYGDPASSRTRGLSRWGGLDGLDELTETMQDHWAHFIHHGNPGEDWQDYHTSASEDPGRATKIFDINPQLEFDPKATQRRAWRDYDMLEWGNGRPELLQELGLVDESPWE